MNLVYIHGANATGNSFNYIRHHLDYPAETVVEYSSSRAFRHNLSHMLETVTALSGPVFFVAHSLGGIYALHMSLTLGDRVTGAVTLSTPYGGCPTAVLAQFLLPFNQLMRDISPGSDVMSSLDLITVPPNWTTVVTTRGNNPFIPWPNDGVVTVDSQKHLARHMQSITTESTHYEVLLSPETVNIIRNKI